MNTLEISSEIDLNFSTASSLSEDIANRLIGENTCLSWYDKLRDHECPAGVSECPCLRNPRISRICRDSWRST